MPSFLYEILYALQYIYGKHSYLWVEPSVCEMDAGGNCISYFWIFIVVQIAKFAKTRDQSICSHYSCFENMGRFVTLKKIQNMDLKKAGCKKQGHCYSKRKKAMLPLLFLINTDPVFWAQLFPGPYFGPDFFQGHKPTHFFKTRIVGADWLVSCFCKFCNLHNDEYSKIWNAVAASVHFAHTY